MFLDPDIDFCRYDHVRCGFFSWGFNPRRDEIFEMIEIGNVQKVLYSQVKVALKNKRVDPDNKKILACKYVYFMADLRTGKKRERELRPKYKEILDLIKQNQAKA